MAGRQLLELAADGVVILGLQREDGTYVDMPGDGEEIRLADEIFFYGPDHQMARFGAFQNQFERSGG